MKSKSKYWLVVLFFIFINTQNKMISKAYSIQFKPSCNLNYFNYGANNHEILFTIGIMKEAPSKFYFNPRLCNIGIGEIWKGKEKELIFNFKFLEFKFKDIQTIYRKIRGYGFSDGDYNIDGFETTGKLYYQNGLKLFNYLKDFENERKIVWVGYSGELIFLNNGWKEQPYNLSEVTNFELNVKLGLNLNITDKKYSDIFKKFDNINKVNLFGLETNFDLLIGLLVYDSFFAGVTGGYNDFFSELKPFSELYYGLKLDYVYKLENFQYFSSKNIEIFLEYIVSNFKYDSFDKFIPKLVCGIKLFYLSKDLKDR
jgi:hypothetical protein